MPAVLRAWLATVVLACTAAAVVAAPVEDLFGLPVVRVIVEIEGVRSADAAYLDLIETRVGQPFDARRVRESIAHLFGLGRFEDVRVYADAVDGGVAVRYELLPAHAVGRISFEGQLGLDEGRLRRAITERYGNAPSAARTSELVKLLEGVYRDHGYLQPRIEPQQRVEHARERTVLGFQIDAGPRVTLNDVRVEGNAPDPLDVIERQLEIAVGQPYDRRRVESRVADYVASLRRTGYYEAQGEHSLEPSADGRTAALVVAMDGGPHITVVFEGDPVPSEVRADLVPIQREASVDEDLLEDSARRLADHFRAQGFRDADVTYTRTPRDGELAVVFRVSKGPQYQVGTVEVTGNASVPTTDLAPLIRLRAGEPFREAALDADVAALTDAYRRRGFAAVKVTPVVLPEPGTEPVRATVQLQVQEGPRTEVGQVVIAGNSAVPESALRGAVASRTGGPFYQPQLAIDRDGMLLQLLNRGYRVADIGVDVTFSEDRSRADIRFDVQEGPQVFVDHVLIVGNEKTSSETIRRELGIEPGDALGFDAIAEAQRRVSALGLFRRVRLSEIDHGEPSRRDVVVTVDEAPATTIGYGGGVEFGRRLVRTSADAAPRERIEVAPRGFFEIGRRNLFGRNRSVNLFTRISLRLREEPVLTEDGEQPATDFNEYRVLGTYRQPRIFGSGDFLATGLLEQGARTSFDFNRRGVRAELVRRISQGFSASARYTLERTEVFNESYSPEDELLIDRLFPQVRLSTVSSSFIRDSRDDALGPTRGALVGIDTELAARNIGSEVGFIKSFVQGFAFQRLPGRRGIVLATGARLGLAAGFAREVPVTDEDGNPVLDPDGTPAVETVDDLPASERFFAGGDTTVRGFALDQLGTPETLDQNGFPVGGNAVLVLNAELRVPVWGDLGGVVFLDVGNVFARVDDFAFGELRGAAGFGVRYRSPIGPLRVDLGFKLDRRLLPNGEPERPTALHISLGQAF